MEGLVIPLCGGRLLFGPPPKSRKNLEYLEEELHVKTIVNISPDTNEITYKGFKRTESYMVHLKKEEKKEEDEEEHEEKDDDSQNEQGKRYIHHEARTDWRKKRKEEEKELHLEVKRLLFDQKAFEPVGRTKELKKQSMGEYYANHIRLVLKEIKNLDQVVYIHGTSGVMEEAYIAFGLWKLMSPKDFPIDVLQWIKEMNYEWLFNDDVEAKEMVNFVLERVANHEKKNNFFKNAKPK